MSLKKKIQRKTLKRSVLKEEHIEEIKVKAEIDEAPKIQKVEITRIEYDPEIRRRKPDGSFTPLEARCTKNIVKNYGKAICNFAASKLAMPYLEPFIVKERLNFEKFSEYILDKKGSIESIESFRILFIVTSEDSEQEASYKRILKEMGIIFIKYFSVNWIYSSKITHKEAHLKFRFKMIRRISNPELFTYLRPFGKKTKN